MIRILTWPISLAVWLVRTILSIVGGFLGFFVGVAMIGVGVLLCKTILLAFLGIPLCLLGGAVAFKSIF